MNAATRVVITGSTRGLGRGMARAFAERGARVVVNGRRDEDCRRVAQDIARSVPVAADVTDDAALRHLWTASVEALGGVDVWINNAGVAVEHAGISVIDTDPAELVRPIRVNLVGTMLASRVAGRGMREQPQGGRIYTLEGFGSDGRRMTGLTAYGTSKAAIRYFTSSLADELRASGNVMVGTISPGMVVTDLLLRPYGEAGPDERTRKILDALADPVDVVAPWIVDRVLAGKHTIRRLGMLRASGRMMLMPFRERGVVPRR